MACLPCHAMPCHAMPHLGQAMPHVPWHAVHCLACRHVLTCTGRITIAEPQGGASCMQMQISSARNARPPDQMQPFPSPGQFVIGWTFHRGAYRALRRGRANMDVLISVGTNAGMWCAASLEGVPCICGGLMAAAQRAHMSKSTCLVPVNSCRPAGHCAVTSSLCCARCSVCVLPDCHRGQPSKHGV